MINRAFSVQIFLLIGWLYRKYESIVFPYVKRASVLLISFVCYCLLGFISIKLYPGQKIDVHHCEYYNIIICQLMIWIGIIALFGFAENNNTIIPKILRTLGQNTLIIYIYHYWVVKIFVKLFGLIHIPINRFTNMIMCALVCFVCLLLSLSVNRIVPGLMGKSKKR